MCNPRVIHFTTFGCRTREHRELSHPAIWHTERGGEKDRGVQRASERAEEEGSIILGLTTDMTVMAVGQTGSGSSWWLWRCSYIILTKVFSHPSRSLSSGVPLTVVAVVAVVVIGKDQLRQKALVQRVHKTAAEKLLELQYTKEFWTTECSQLCTNNLGMAPSLPTWHAPVEQATAMKP